MSTGTNPDRDRSFFLLKNLARHSAVYGFFDFLGRAGAIVLVPLYARVLGPDGFGTLELYLVTQTFLVLFLGMGFNSALTKYYVTSDSASEKLAFFSTAFTGLIVAAGLAAAALALTTPWWGPLFGAALAASNLWRILLATVFFEVVVVICLALFRAQERSHRYSMLNLAKLGVALGMNILLVAVLNWGIRGVLVGNLTGAAVAAGLAVVFVREGLRFRIDREKWRLLAAFGFPLVLGGLAMFALNSADRYFLKALSSPVELGLYALAYKIGMLMSLAVNAFVLAWSPALFQIAKTPDARSTLARMPTYYLMVYLPCFLALTLFARELVWVAGSTEFQSADRLVGPVVFSFLLSGLFMVFNMGAALTNKTKIVPVVVIAAFVVNTGANLWLIPTHGAWGAAAATVIAFLVLVGLSYAMNQRLYPAPLEWGRVFILVAWTAALLAGGVLFLDGESLPWILARAGVLLLFPLGLVVFRVLDAEEWGRVRAMAGRFGGR